MDARSVQGLLHRQRMSHSLGLLPPSNLCSDASAFGYSGPTWPIVRFKRPSGGGVCIRPESESTSSICRVSHGTDTITGSTS